MNRRVQPQLFVEGSAVVDHCATSCASRVVRPRRCCEIGGRRLQSSPQRVQGRLPCVARRPTGRGASETRKFDGTRPLAHRLLSPASDRVYRCQSVSKLQSSRLALVQRSLTGACTKSRALRAGSNRATALLAEGCIERRGRESRKRHANQRRESNRRTPPPRAHQKQRRESNRETHKLTSPRRRSPPATIPHPRR